MAMMTNEQWLAIIQNDAAYDDQFIYAVKTTGIFCKPSCKSRAPVKHNVQIFGNAAQALSANFRPCKRCEPTGTRLPDNDWVFQITRFIESNYKETLTLDTIANGCHGSPYHLHRTFKRLKGITTAEFVQQTRINKASQYLTESTMTIAEIAAAVGMTSTAYFVTLFKKKTGLTPTEFRQCSRLNKQEG
jgi:AraC family transcriptional regulator of adaptative response / methylphosphotriester-DNA alkyltransferase methyltransferase